MSLPHLATTIKLFSHFTFRPFTFSIIVFGTLTLLSACKDGDEEPSPLEPDPVITSFTPTNGLVGTTVIITGQNFSSNMADNVVKVGNTAAAVTAATTTSITITIPIGAVTGKISVTVKGKSVTSANDFVVINGPVIASFTPTAGVAGTTEVVITGENFSTTIADNVVKIGNVVATVTAATTTSITITVPSGAVTGKISVTVAGTTITSANDFVVVTGPSDFFTLTVDASYETSQIDNWILASSKSGDWIDVQPFESGETITLNGIVPDASSFTLHFLTVSPQAGYFLFRMNSIADIPVKGTWLLKTPALPTYDPKTLTLNVTNLPSNPGAFNETITVSASEVASSIYSNFSGNTVNMEVTVLNSPTDIFLTLYENGYPKYVSYENVTLPSTINLDASTEAVAADRNFTITLPTNNLYAVAIDAYEQDETFSHSMSRYFNSSGGTSVNLGYKQGYQKYRTAINYRDGKKSFDLVASGPTVEETHTFPSFDFTITNTKANDFQAVSVLPYDAAGINFQHNETGLVLLWYVLQPGSGTSGAINFKAKAFPQEILDKYSALPPVDQVQFGIVYGYQFSSGNYADIIDAASKSGSILNTPSSDNYIRFGKQRD